MSCSSGHACPPCFRPEGLPVSARPAGPSRDLSEVTAIIVTGAGTGIGAAAAIQLAAQGRPVTLVGRREPRLAETAAAIEAAGGRCLVLPADLADPAGPAMIAGRTAAAFGGIAGLVNNAATIRTMPLADYTLATIDEHLAVNIRAPFLMTQAAMPRLVEARGAVVNISSSSGTLVRSGQSLYGMTKAALEYLTRSIAGEFAANGVRVNAIAYGPADTPIHETWATDLDAARAWLKDQVPLGRIASAEEAARWIVLLLSPDAGWLTGAVIPFDGGQTLDI
jgi:NAD(P)-dependent dehydrogenase (short-subunit alcohol dehydrogenase family)